MFANELALLALLALFATTVVSVASKDAPSDSFPVGQWDSTNKKCSVGQLYCCNELDSVQSAKQRGVFSTSSRSLDKLSGLVGIKCNPTNASVGASINSCNALAACCSAKKFSHETVVGCTEIKSST